MNSLSRSQLALYGAVAVALLLVGARWIRAEPSHQASAATGQRSIPFPRQRPARRRRRGRGRH